METTPDSNRSRSMPPTEPTSDFITQDLEINFNRFSDGAEIFDSGLSDYDPDPVLVDKPIV